VRPFAQVPAHEWDAVVADSPDGWLYQTTAWMAFEDYQGNPSHSFGLESARGELVAVFPLYLWTRTAMRFIPIRILATGLSGPAIRSTVTGGTRQKLWQRLFEVADGVARDLSADIFQARLTTTAPGYLPPARPEYNPLWNVGLSGGFRTGLAEPRAQLTRLAQIDRSDEELLQELDKDCRAAVRQAQRSGVEIVAGGSLEDVEAYAALHEESWRRTNLVPHGRDHFAQMHSAIGSDHFVTLFAVHGGRRVAGVLLHRFKDAGYYWGGCSIEEAKPLRANNILLYGAMRWLRDAGCRWFEIGWFPPHSSDSKDKDYQIGRFKQQFGRVTLVPFLGQKMYRPRKLAFCEAARAVLHS
jgi:lipid II:glycine glycyltransferase (peptidoglycan interpeptide bridge formation enzyme)